MLPAYQWTGITFVCLIVSFVNVWRIRKAKEEWEREMRTFGDLREFFTWGGQTRIVVRDKLSHREVTDVLLYQLFLDFKNGNAFRNAKLMFDNDEFKVYARGKQVDLKEWEAIRKASEGE